MLVMIGDDTNVVQRAREWRAMCAAEWRAAVRSEAPRREDIGVEPAGEDSGGLARSGAVAVLR
jgi:hypothetical protein